MLDPLACTLLFSLIYAGLIYWKRNALFGQINPFGVLVIAWFFLNYLGTLVLFLAPNYVLDTWNQFNFSFYGEAAAERMALAQGLGQLCVLLGGLWLLPRNTNDLLSRQQSAIESRPGPTLSIAIISFAILSLWGLGAIFSSYGWKAPIVALFTSGFSEAYFWRVEGEGVSQVAIYILWNVIPFLAAYVIGCSYAWRKIYPMLIPIGFSAFIIASFFLLSSLHKRQYVIWLAGLIFVFMLLGNARGRRGKSTIKLVLGGSLLFVLLSFLFAVFSNASSIMFGRASEVAFLEIFFRGTLSAIPYYSLMPELVDFHEFGNIGIVKRILGQQVTYSDTQILFQYVHLDSDGLGTISSHFITDFYGAHGWITLILGCFGVGLFTAALTRFYLTLQPTVLNQVFKAMILLFPLNLCSATFFQTLLGYGFIFYVLTWSFLGLFRARSRALQSQRYPAPGTYNAGLANEASQPL